MFPGYKEKRFGYINLNEEWRRRKRMIEQSSRMLDPKFCAEFVDLVHSFYGLDASYGGWLERRDVIWADSYLEKDSKFLHLGVDLNVPSGTDVAVDCPGIVIKVDDDHPDPFGWGTRVFILLSGTNVCLVYAHLDPESITVSMGTWLKPGVCFGCVGTSENNGGWYPHLHIQTMHLGHFLKLQESGTWSDLDGYGYFFEIGECARKHHDPMQYLRLG